MNKKYIAFGLMGFFALALVSAAVVNYWGQTEVDMMVEDSFNVEEVLCILSVVAGDGSYKLCEFAATNNLDRELDVDFELKVQKKNGAGNYVPLIDDAGVYVGFSEDLQYAYDVAYNPNNDDWETWMLANLDWFDWDVLTQVYAGGYYDTTIINGVGRTGYTPLTSGVLSIADQTIPANYELHGVIYMGSGLNLESGEYRVILDAIDVSEVTV